jgi:glycerate 2-kinase
VFARHGAALIATPRDMLEAAAQAAKQAGLRAYILSDRIEGEARDVGHRHAMLALGCLTGAPPADLLNGLRIERPCVLLSGGETTVTLGTPAVGAAGHGGRCRELLLSAALGLQGQAGIWMLAADTDGIDGHGPAAGAWIGPDTLQRAHALGLDGLAMLAAHDAGRFFAALHDEIVTGPTHTNVNDFRAVLVA